MSNLLMTGMFVFVGLMVVCMVASIILTARGGKSSVWMTRGLYVFGIIASVLNAIRIFLERESYKGTMVFASVVVVFCLIYGLIRSEKGDPLQQRMEEEARENETEE